MRYITLSEYLRPWAQLGITHLLPDYSGIEVSGSDSLYDNSLTFSRTSSPVRREYPLSNDRSSSLNDINSHDPLSLKEASQPYLEVNKRISCAYVLPPSWEIQLAKTSSSLVVWSYPELGFDLNGLASPERSFALKSLIGKLNLPKGTNSFWPMALPNDQGELVVDVDSYIFGLEKISPQIVLLLGKNSSSSIHSVVNLDVPFTQQLIEGRLYILLPDLLSIYSDANSLEKTCLYLKTVFSSLNILSFK